VFSITYFVIDRTVGRVLGWHCGSKNVVMTYHSIHDVEITRFAAQMRLLSRSSIPAVFADYESSDGRPSIAVTFDDAFQNVFDRALPVMARYSIPATVFVPTGYLGSSPGWIVAGHNPQRADGAVVSERGLKNIDRRLVMLGSHTVTHPHLASVTEEKLNVELGGSKQTLEGITGAPVAMLSLPYGECTAEVLQVAHRVGYSQVFANVPVMQQSAQVVSLIGRIDVSPRDWAMEFWLKMQGAYNWMAIAVPAKRELLHVFGKVAAE